MTPAEADVLLHTLGLDRAEEPYRDRYVSRPDCDGWAALLSLEAAGLMERRRSPGFLPEGDVTFGATAAGKRAAIAEAARRRPRLTRAQARYRRFLKADGVFPTFLDFLRHLEWERKGGAQP